MEILTAFIIGLAGSLHCIGMCGPILLALPSAPKTNSRFIFGRIIYNIGRVLTYSLFGFLFGLAGKGLSLFGFQRWISILTGAIIIIYILLPSNLKKIFLSIPLFISFTNKIKFFFGKLFQKKSVFTMLFIGILNGFLPCGFVYMAVAGSLTTGDAYKGMLFMALFGLGTVPVMFASSLIINFFGKNFIQKIKRLMPVFAVILALIFILRGLNLGIPYLSPKLKMHSSMNSQQ